MRERLRFEKELVDLGLLKVDYETPQEEAAKIAQNWADLRNLAISSCERRIIDFIKTLPWLNVNYNSTRDAPIHHLGYVVGMALMYARLYCVLETKNGNDTGYRFVTAMSKAPVGDSTNDALNQFNLEFTTGRNKGLGLNITEHSDGVPTLRKVFTLLFGLGMQESEGDYSVGFNLDKGETAKTKKAAASEAGGFQISHTIGVEGTDAIYKNIRDLYLLYQRLQGQGSLLEFFKIGKIKFPNPTAHKADTETQAAAAAGVKFQKLIYKNPAFSVVLAALGIRFRRRHWGTLDNDRDATLKRECYDMFRSIETILNENKCCFGMGFVRTDYTEISHSQTGLFATDISKSTDALWIVGNDSQNGQSKLFKFDKTPVLYSQAAQIPVKKVSIDNNNNPCIIDTNGNIFLSDNNPANPFTQLPNQLASDIAFESDGTMWILDAVNKNVNGFEIKMFNKLTSKWEVIGGRAVKILIAKDDTPWVINKQGGLFFRTSVGWSIKNTAEKVTDFAIGPNNEIWMIGEIDAALKNGRIYRVISSGDCVSYDGAGVAIEIDLDTALPYVLNSSGSIYKMK